MSDFKELSRSVKDLTVLVTGAASGTGRATARLFAAERAPSVDNVCYASSLFPDRAGPTARDPREKTP